MQQGMLFQPLRGFFRWAPRGGTGLGRLCGTNDLRLARRAGRGGFPAGLGAARRAPRYPALRLCLGGCGQALADRLPRCGGPLGSGGLARSGPRRTGGPAFGPATTGARSHRRAVDAPGPPAHRRGRLHLCVDAPPRAARRMVRASVAQRGAWLLRGVPPGSRPLLSPRAPLPRVYRLAASARPRPGRALLAALPRRVPRPHAAGGRSPGDGGGETSYDDILSQELSPETTTRLQELAQAARADRQHPRAGGVGAAAAPLQQRGGRWRPTTSFLA